MTAKYRITWRHTVTGQGGSTPYFYPQLAADEIARVANELAPEVHHYAEEEDTPCVFCHGTGYMMIRDSQGGPSTLIVCRCTD